MFIVIGINVLTNLLFENLRSVVVRIIIYNKELITADS